jgi:predicted RNA-binding protein with PIN domain
MNTYIIDGNNLIGRIKSLSALQKKDKQSSREKLTNILNRYFSGKKARISLHFDGHPNITLPFSKGSIYYSLNQPSDNLIKKEIENSNSPRLIILVTSDHNLMNFGRVCGCTILSSDEFYGLIEKSLEKNDETEKIKQLEKQKDEFLKLFRNSENN